VRKEFLFAFLLLPTTAFAQANDPGLSACQALLSQSNGQTIQMAVQAQNLSKQLDDAKAELAKLKAPEQPTAPK
jgi:hypothetical protein